MNEMNERTATAEDKVMALEQRLHAVNKLNQINRGQFAMKCLGDAVIRYYRRRWGITHGFGTQKSAVLSIWMQMWMQTHR